MSVVRLWLLDFGFWGVWMRLGADMVQGPGFMRLALPFACCGLSDFSS